MDRKQRVIWSDNGTLVDVSRELGDFRREDVTFSLVYNQDKLYVGAELPFNHKYFNVGTTVNAVASVVSVQLWDGTDWRNTVDLNDGTSDGGKSLGQSGTISWAMDLEQSGWNRQFDSDDITALAGLRIFNLYWARFSWTASLTTGTVLKYIGERFSDDTDLFDQYPDLRATALMTAFASGKTSWREQHLMAAEAIVRQLRRDGIVIRKEQIMDDTLYNDASIHKTAAIIYNGLGNGFSEKWKRAEELYRKSLDIKFHEVDTNASGHADDCEKSVTTSWGTR